MNHETVCFMTSCHSNHFLSHTNLWLTTKLKPCSIFSDIEHREGGEPYVHSSVVGAPNVTMSITDRNGNGIQAAQVGDPLSLRFEILEKSSKYICIPFSCISCLHNSFHFSLYCMRETFRTRTPS